MKIKEVKAKSIFDSRKEPTIEISVLTQIGRFVSSAPEGKSTGRFEAKPFAKSLNKDTYFLNNLKIQKLKVEEFKDLIEVEGLTKGCIGANSLFSLESSILKALAAEQEKELWEFLSKGVPKKIPFPVGNTIGGGMHTKEFQNKKTDFQEFLTIPKAKTFKESVFLMQKIHEETGKILGKKNAKGPLNDENAWSTSLNNEECLETISEAKNKISDETNNKVELGIDVAASEFFRGAYFFKNKKQKLSSSQQINYIAELIKRFNLGYIEDPLQQEDFAGFSLLKKRVNAKIVGDDLTVTNLTRLKKAIQNKSINAIIIKPNQNGSLLKVKEICDFCRENEISLVFSHRSGETLDNTIADLAMAWKADFIKTGIFGKEREAKLNRVIKIEQEL